MFLETITIDDNVIASISVKHIDKTWPFLFRSVWHNTKACKMGNYMSSPDKGHQDEAKLLDEYQVNLNLWHITFIGTALFESIENHI